MTCQLQRREGQGIHYRDSARRDPGSMLGVSRKIGSVVADVGSRQDANRFVLNILIAFLPAAILGLLFIKTIKQYLFHPVPVATAFIVGGLDPLGGAQEARGGSRRWKTWIETCAQGGINAMPGADTGHFTLRRNHHRRSVFWPVSQSRHRIFLLSRHPDHVCRHLLRCLQKS